MDQHSYIPRSQIVVAGEGEAVTAAFVASAVEGAITEPQEEYDDVDEDVVPLVAVVVVAACGKRYRKIPKPTKETTDQQLVTRD